MLIFVVSLAVSHINNVIGSIMTEISLNFLAFQNQDFGITIYRKKLEGNQFEQGFDYYDFKDEEGNSIKYQIAYSEHEGFEKYKLPAYAKTGLVSKTLFDDLKSAAVNLDFFIRKDTEYNRRIHFTLEKHSKGRKCIWIEPYYLKAKNIWGLLFDFCFVVDKYDNGEEKYKLDKDILIASGTMNSKGGSNFDYYLFKHSYQQSFIQNYVPKLNQGFKNTISTELTKLPSRLLNPKVYIFGGNNIGNSSYLGLSKYPPLEVINGTVQFYFLYRKTDRDIAVSLLKGLRGELSPNTFSGMNKLFKVNFANDVIKGSAMEDFSDTLLDAEILKINALGDNVIPIIITNSKKDSEDDRLYFRLKHKFTQQKIPCQVVTKDLVKNEYSLKYSLSNIGLQLFAKAGGKPWKMKPTTAEYLIIGIGQSYTIEKGEAGNNIKKNITYSVLTDSSGIFKDIQVLGEGVDTDDSYYLQLVNNISLIINNAGHKKISIHVPFRISREKIIEKVVSKISADVELSVLVINQKNDFFGFDYSSNALVPFESTFIKLSHDEYLVWFEGLQFNNPKVNKRFGNPLLIKFWFFSNKQHANDMVYKERLLQDCINLSGANWRGFKAKQLPVSVFYCQRIAEFIGKFQEYNLSHIDINNLKPWFL